MRTRTSQFCLAALGLLTGACALAGYDFGDYERANVTSSPAVAGTASGGASGGASAASGASAIATTSHGLGGDPNPSAGQGAGGDATAGTNSGVGGEPQGPTPFGACEARSCFALGLACGPADDGCGQALDCGPCFWWFQECVENRCEIPE